jgi:hypothetical protein
VFWWSNNPTAPTGYGGQTKAVVTRLLRAGHPVAIGSNWGTEGTMSTWTSDDGHTIPVYPRGYDGYSQDVIVSNWQDFGSKQPEAMPTIMVTLYDVWVLTNPRLAEVPVVSWVPVDHLPVPPQVAGWCGKDNVRVVAMSKFGQEQLARKDIESVYIPHTFEDVFHPTDPDGILNVPDDSFLVMMNAANKGGGNGHARKAWSENFLALGMFMAKHDDVYAYIHTEAQCPAGIDLMSLAQAAGIDGDRLLWPAQYSYRMGHFDEPALARLYSRADVLLAASMGEGFGIPVVEAQACGTRVIVSNFSAQPELASADSWKVDGQPVWNPQQGAFLFTPHVSSIVEALEASYSSARGASQVAVSKAGEYKADRVFKQSWKPLLKEFA